jgi:hypothetical protein
MNANDVMPTLLPQKAVWYVFAPEKCNTFSIRLAGQA